MDKKLFCCKFACQQFKGTFLQFNTDNTWHYYPYCYDWNLYHAHIILGSSQVKSLKTIKNKIREKKTARMIKNQTVTKEKQTATIHRVFMHPCQRPGWKPRSSWFFQMPAEWLIWISVGTLFRRHSCKVGTFLDSQNMALFNWRNLDHINPATLNWPGREKGRGRRRRRIAHSLKALKNMGMGGSIK